MNTLTYIYKTAIEVLEIQADGHYITSLFNVRLEKVLSGGTTVEYNIWANDCKLPVGYISNGDIVKILD